RPGSTAAAGPALPPRLRSSPVRSWEEHAACPLALSRSIPHQLPGGSELDGPQAEPVLRVRPPVPRDPAVHRRQLTHDGIGPVARCAWRSPPATTTAAAR